MSSARRPHPPLVVAALGSSSSGDWDFEDIRNKHILSIMGKMWRDWKFRLTSKIFMAHLKQNGAEETVKLKPVQVSENSWISFVGSRRNSEFLLAEDIARGECNVIITRSETWNPTSPLVPINEATTVVLAKMKEVPWTNDLAKDYLVLDSRYT